MRKLFLSAGGFLVLAGAVVLAHGSALAASPDDLDVEKAQLRKENSDLREMLRMRQENAALRRRLGQSGVEAPAPLPLTQSPRLQAASPAPSGETWRADPAPRSGSPSVFESYAADMPAKAPLPVRAALYNWTGFYVGANIGYSVGNDRTSTRILDPTPGGVLDVTFADVVAAPKGVLGGVQLGYNWQATRNWLVGFEADFQAANQTDRVCAITCFRGGGLETTYTVEQKLEYFGTLRARLGVVSDNVLFYATGGPAFGHVNQTVSTFQITPPFGTTSATSVAGETRFGWAAGGGIEAALSGNWTLKAEYLYMNLGDMKPNVFNGAFPAPGGPIPTVVTTNSTIRDHIVRAGINYRFSDAPLNAYASARGVEAYAAYTPVYNWTGFYAGGNAGYGAGVNRLSQSAGSTTGILNAQTSTADSVIAPKGFAGGVQIGYNFQGGRNWLVGFEADIQGTNQSDKTCTPTLCIVQTQVGLGRPTTTIALTSGQQLDWFGTVRGRVGVVNNNILFYATGGVAFGQVKQSIAENVNAGGTAVFNTVASNHNLTGWTAGGGIEAALWGNWTAKAEYLYLDLGSIKTTLDDGGPPGGVIGSFDTTSTVRDHIFRAGVNYRFGEPGPVVAKY